VPSTWYVTNPDLELELELVFEVALDLVLGLEHARGSGLEPGFEFEPRV
jgi:hypothetical protein